jgi:hypothetical protein
MTSLVSLNQVLDRSLAVQAQLTDWEVRGEQVREYRDFYDGDHPANMTTEMRKLLRVKSTLSGGEFNDNYMQIVVDTMADRVALDAIVADNQPATQWAQDVLEANNIDELQGDIHDAAIRDGETFLMVSWDNEEQRVVLTHELAYDGTSGMLVLYRSSDLPIMEAAIKIWVMTAEDGGIADTVRMNVYYPNRICKFISRDGTSFVPYDDPAMPPEETPGEYAWTDKNGQPLGIPVIPFRNRGRKNQGLSELANAIPLQNALNRILHSVVMTSELAAFVIRWIKGAPAPRDLTPGMIVAFGETGLSIEQAAAIDTGAWDAGDMSQQLATAQWITNEIGKVTRTPAPEFAGSDGASGEALKQREIGLLGKVKRFQIKAGASWATVVKTAYAVQSAYGNLPIAATRFYAKWKDAEIRNDQMTVDNALKIADRVDERTFLETVAPVYGWDAKKIDAILAAKQTAPPTGAATDPSYTPDEQANLMATYRQMRAEMIGANGNAGS